MLGDTEKNVDIICPIYLQLFPESQTFFWIYNNRVVWFILSLFKPTQNRRNNTLMWEPFLLRNQNRQFCITQCLCALSTAWFHFSRWICLFFKWKHLSIPRIRLFLKCIHISPLFILSFQCRTGYAGDGYACGLDSDLDGRPDVDLDCQGLGDYMHCHKVILFTNHSKIITPSPIQLE